VCCKPHRLHFTTPSGLSRAHCGMRSDLAALVAQSTRQSMRSTSVSQPVCASLRRPQPSSLDMAALSLRLRLFRPATIWNFIVPNPNTQAAGAVVSTAYRSELRGFPYCPSSIAAPAADLFQVSPMSQFAAQCDSSYPVAPSLAYGDGGNEGAHVQGCACVTFETIRSFDGSGSGLIRRCSDCKAVARRIREVAQGRRE